MSELDKFVVCPLNRHHIMKRHRLRFHIKKCQGIDSYIRKDRSSNNKSVLMASAKKDFPPESALEIGDEAAVGSLERHGSMENICKASDNEYNDGSCSDDDKGPKVKIAKVNANTYAKGKAKAKAPERDNQAKGNNSYDCRASASSSTGRQRNRRRNRNKRSNIANQEGHVSMPPSSPSPIEDIEILLTPASFARGGRMEVPKPSSSAPAQKMQVSQAPSSSAPAQKMQVSVASSSTAVEMDTRHVYTHMATGIQWRQGEEIPEAVKKFDEEAEELAMLVAEGKVSIVNSPGVVAHGPMFKKRLRVRKLNTDSD